MKEMLSLTGAFIIIVAVIVFTTNKMIEADTQFGPEPTDYHAGYIEWPVKQGDPAWKVQNTIDGSELQNTITAEELRNADIHY